MKMKIFSRIFAKPVFLNPLLLFEASIGGREIHRTDSSGSDITRFKFTGQEEDKESGLMYYKARYYGLAAVLTKQTCGIRLVGFYKRIVLLCRNLCLG
jgi:hypothetical protein